MASRETPVGGGEDGVSIVETRGEWGGRRDERLVAPPKRLVPVKREVKPPAK